MGWATKASIEGVDVVELVPSRDVNEIGAFTAARKRVSVARAHYSISVVRRAQNSAYRVGGDCDWVGHRLINNDHVELLKESIDRIGLTTPIFVVIEATDFTLIAGQHRVEAMRRLGRTHIDALVLDPNGSNTRFISLHSCTAITQ